MKDFLRPTTDQVDRFLEKTKGKGHMTLKVLAGVHPFIMAMESEIGQQILQDDIDRHEALLMKLYKEEITPEELAEFRYLKLRLDKTSKRINAYVNGVSEIIKEGAQ